MYNRMRRNANVNHKGETHLKHYLRDLDRVSGRARTPDTRPSKRLRPGDGISHM